MKKINIVLRITLFTLILSLGIITAWFLGETTSLALADLSDATVEAMTRAANGDTLYAVLGDDKQGIFRSDDSGRSWQMISNTPAANISTIAVHSANKQMLYAGTSGGQITNGDTSLWYSSDKGRTWSRYGITLPASPEGELPTVNVITADPNHPGLLYVGTEGKGLFRVDARGFSRIGNVALFSLYVKDVIAVPDGPIYAVTTEGLLAVEGDEWRKIEPLPDGIVSLAVDPTNPNMLYIGTVGYGAYRSVDGGKTWQSTNAGLGLQPGIILRVSTITVDKDNPQHLALATAFGVGSHLSPDGIYQSFDGGQNWERVADTNQLVNRLTIKEGGIYAATAKGLVRYGAPLSPAPLLQLRLLVSSPTVTQSVILVLTVVFGGFSLLGRMAWPLWRRQSTL